MFQHINDNNTHPKTKACYPALSDKVHEMNKLAFRAVKKCYHIIDQLQKTQQQVAQNQANLDNFSKSKAAAHQKIDNINRLADKLDRLIEWR